MYEYIVNPLTGRKAKASSTLGREIISNYMYMANGGYLEPKKWTGGVEKCGNFICDHDIIDYEDIQKPCVAANENTCTSCDNIKQLRTLDVPTFNEDPLKKMFNMKATPEQINDFWSQLYQTCGISTPTAQESIELQLMKVVEADVYMCQTNAQKIMSRINKICKQDLKLLKKAEMYMEAFMKMVLLAPIWNERTIQEPNLREDDFQTTMRNDILAVIMEHKLLFGGAHHPREIPVAISIYLDELSSASDLKLLESIKFMTKQKGCAEGVLQLAIDKLQIHQDHE